MSQKTRQALYIIFLLSFLIITPMVLLYAMGYSFKLSWPIRFNQTLQKTGMLIIDSEPRGAKIYLNDKIQKPFLQKYFPNSNTEIRTPAKIKNLAPGDYNLRIELDGYWPWTKKLTVNPGGSTFAENISLFRNNLSTIVNQEDNISSLYSKDNKYFFVAGKDKITSIRQDDESFISTTTKQSQFTRPIYQSANGKFIYYDGVVYESDTLTKKIDLNTAIGGNIADIKWDGDSDEKLYYIQNNKVNFFNLNNLVNTTLSSGIASSSNNEKIIDYLVKNEKLYTAKQFADKKCVLNITSFSDNTSRDLNIPGANEYSFIDYNNKYINLLNKSKKELYIINENNASSPLEITINNINSGQWVDGDKFLYSNDFELWLMDLKNNNKKLLTRISQEIEHILWHPNDNYAIYSTSNSINIIELDEREKRNITEITKFDQIGKIYLNSKGDLLYFEGKINNKEGLYKLTIQ